jgi:hypothetical protein
LGGLCLARPQSAAGDASVAGQVATSGLVHSHAARADGTTRRPRSARRSRSKCRMRITHQAGSGVRSQSCPRRLANAARGCLPGSLPSCASCASRSSCCCRRRVSPRQRAVATNVAKSIEEIHDRPPGARQIRWELGVGALQQPATRSFSALLRRAGRCAPRGSPVRRTPAAPRSSSPPRSKDRQPDRRG